MMPQTYHSRPVTVQALQCSPGTVHTIARWLDAADSVTVQDVDATGAILLTTSEGVPFIVDQGMWVVFNTAEKQWSAIDDAAFRVMYE